MSRDHESSSRPCIQRCLLVRFSFGTAFLSSLLLQRIALGSDDCWLHSKVLEVLIPPVTQLFGVWIAMPALILVIVEIPRVGRPSQMWHNWSLDLAVVHLLPVDVFEPLMLLHARCAACNVTQAFGHVDGAKSGDQVACRGGHGAGEADFALYDSGTKSATEFLHVSR